MLDQLPSLWDRTTSRTHAEPAPSPSIDGRHADVVVIGAGITGLTAAILLMERGRSVIVLDKEGVMAGDSGRTTAHLTESIDARYHTLKRQFGLDAMRDVAAASRAAIDTIETLATRYAIDCRFRRLPGYLYTEKRSQVAPLKSEAASAKDCGVAASFITDVPLPFPTRAAVRFEQQAQMHPGAYLQGLAAQLGERIVSGVRVENVTEGAPCVLATDRGRVTAGAVFIATHTPLNDVFTTQFKVAAYRTYVIAARVQGVHPEGLFWDTADPYHYTRWQETDDGTYIIVGGADHKVGQEPEGDPFDTLLAFARERFGMAAMPIRWSGQILETIDGLPYIGRNLGAEHVYLSTGYAGQGMTFGTVGASLVADLITGVANPLAAIFDPKRISASKELITENVDYPLHLLKDRVLQLDVETTRTFDVKSGQGKIVLHGTRKLAVARDEAGQLHALSPVCTHMKCDVAWNGTERSWDCPCHGSRFSIDGAVLNGPASEPLERVAIEEEDKTRL